MIDFHTHILPGIDDGAKDEEESRAMLEMLSEQGVFEVCLTPHYISYKEPLEAFLCKRAEAVEKIEDYADELGIRLFIAAEVSLTKELSRINEAKELCVEGTRLMLVEIPAGMTKEDLIYNIERLINSLGVIPVIAHIERYEKALYSKKLLEYLLELGCLTQITLSALKFGGWRKKRKMLKLLRTGKIHFVGTDCHNLSSRPPVFADYIDILEERLGGRFVKRFERKANKRLDQIN